VEKPFGARRSSRQLVKFYHSFAVELSTSGTVPSVRSSRRNPRNRRSRQLGSHGSHGSHRNLGSRQQQRRLPSRRCQPFPYRRDETWRD